MDYNDPAVHAKIEERMFRVQESHEAAIVLRNELAKHTTGMIRTNRHSGSDDQHIEMDQKAAQDLIELINKAHTTIRAAAELADEWAFKGRGEPDDLPDELAGTDHTKDEENDPT